MLNARTEKSTNVRSRNGRGPSRQLEAVRLGLRLTSAISTRLASRWAEHLFTTPRRFSRPPHELALVRDAHPFIVPWGPEHLVAWRFTAPPSGPEALRLADSDAPVILLVHGWEGRGTQLGAFVDPLLRRGFDVVTFDGPAHGDSAGRRATLPGFADALLAVARAAGNLHGVVAHSFGAAATTIALDGSLRVRRAAYLAPAARPRGATTRFARALSLEAAVRAGLERNLERHLHRRFDEVDATVLASRRTEPLLIVHDPEDRDVPFDEGAALARAWSGATLMPAPGLGHRKLLRDDGVVERVAAFVAQP